MKKKIAIIQARMSSSRLPGKVLMDIEGKPALWHLLQNIKHSKQLTHIILATTKNKADDQLVAFAKKNGVISFRGSEENVLERFYQAARSVGATDTDIIVRITGDDIFMDPNIIDAFVAFLDSTYPQYKLISNSFKEGFPYGLYFEVFDFASLKEANRKAKTLSEKEHVTPYIREHGRAFPAISVESKDADLSDIYLSIDTEKDLERNRRILKYFGSKRKKQPFLFHDVVNAYRHLKLKK